MLRTGPNPNLWFLFQNISYILAFVALGVGVLAEARLRAASRAAGGSGWRRRHAPQLAALRRGVLLTCALRFCVAYFLIFGDGEGGGQMFTYRGVVELFRTKGDGWVVGLWMELCTLFVLAAVWMLDDDAARRPARRLGTPAMLLCLLLTFFVAGFGFVLYLLLRGGAGSGGGDGGGDDDEDDAHREEDEAAAAAGVAAARRMREKIR